MSHDLQLRLSPSLSTPSTRPPNSNAELAVCSTASASSTITIETSATGLVSALPHNTVAVSSTNMGQGPVDPGLMPTAPSTSCTSLNSSRNGTMPVTGLTKNPMGQDTLGLSVGLPPELLPSWSYSSSGLGSESEGDTVKSALASALGLLGQSTEGSALLSMGASFEGTSMGASSLSQSARSLPRDPDSRNASPTHDPASPTHDPASPTHDPASATHDPPSPTYHDSRNSHSPEPPKDPELSGTSQAHHLPPRELLSPESVEVSVVASELPVMWAMLGGLPT